MTLALRRITAYYPITFKNGVNSKETDPLVEMPGIEPGSKNSSDINRLRA